ncbi:kanadaptin-like isoform X2 [Paramacrobiotus metropolitanus]|nr:kanadaptin-like isoform X2 [Paramacrobiotus metropolitanus]XP_055338675.1 kanadaptin-like isoform X2 [Paramacrobiotus metropolitanus]
MADMRVAKAAALEKKSDDTAKEVPKETEDSGIDWGFGTDASDEVEEKEVGFLEAAVSGDDAYFRDDPKKALNAFFVREGMDMEYDVEEIGQGYKKQFLCRIPLPVETTNGRQLVAEATVHGKKKEALAAAILEACRILHAKGVLKGTTSVGRQRKARNWADEDYYDSDEDAYLDRTGTVERKRQQRMQRAKTAKQETETFDSLSQRLEDVKKEMLDVTEKLQMADKNKAASMGDGGVDALDSFMEAIKSGLIMDPKTKIKLRQRLSELKLEEARLIRLINIVKPLDLPAILPSFSSKPLKPEPEPNAEGFSYGRLKAAPLPPRSAPVYDHGNVEEFKAEEDDEDGGRGDAGDQNKDVQSSTAFQDPVSQVIFDCAPTKTANEQQNEAVNSEIKRKTSMSTSPEEERIISSGSAADVRPYLPQSKKKKIDRKGNYEYDASDPDYAMWVPPEDQAGDGKTNLNARLGY